MSNKKESPSWMVNFIANSIVTFATSYICMLTLGGLGILLSYQMTVFSVVSLKLLYATVRGSYVE